MVQTGRPDAFYSRLTDLAASGVTARFTRSPRRTTTWRRLPIPGEVVTEPVRPVTPAAAPSVFASAARPDLSLGLMLWSRRSVFLGVLLGGPVVPRSRCARSTRSTPRGSRQRRPDQRLGGIRHDDLAALYPVHRPGARRLYGRRSSPTRSTTRRLPIWCSIQRSAVLLANTRVSGVHDAPGAAVGDAGVSDRADRRR